MRGKQIEVSMGDGVANAYVSRPVGTGPWPAIVFFMDAIGLRATLFEMADRLASFGYFVLLPDLYYRLGSFRSPGPQKGFRKSRP